jgi:molybdopterin synthase sulfur carrier subunit
VRKGCRHSDGWGPGNEASPESETRDKTENAAHEERQAGEPTVMQVLFNIPGPLRDFTQNQSDVRVDVKAGADLLKALQVLFTAYPGLRDRVLTEAGEVREHVNIFVANEDVRYTGGLATTILPGVEVSIVPAISGGW